MENNKKDKKIGFQSYGGLSEKQNAEIGMNLPKVKGFNFENKFDRELYVWQKMKGLEKAGMVPGNMMKYRKPNTKQESKNRDRTSAGVMHLQPISSGVALGMYDTGETKSKTGIKLRYMPNITVFNEKNPEDISDPKRRHGDVLNQKIASALTVRRGQSSGGRIWNKSFRQGEKKYVEELKASHPEMNGFVRMKLARKMFQADPKNPVHYTTLKHGSKEWLGAFNLLYKNIVSANKNKHKSLYGGIYKIPKHDKKYLKEKLGVI